MKSNCLAKAITIGFSIIFINPVPIFAYTQDKLGNVATIRSFEGLFSNILGIALRLVGLAMFIMIIVGGFKLLTAGSDAKAAEAGQQTITMAIIGLVAAVGAWFILLAIKTITGVDVTQFTLGLPD